MAARPASLRARNLTRGRVLAASVEDAAGLWAKFMGLMGRPSLARDAALWLPDSNGIHMMFMRFPIDAVFVGRPDPSHDGARPVRERPPGAPYLDGARPAGPRREGRPGAAGRRDRREWHGGGRSDRAGANRGGVAAADSAARPVDPHAVIACRRPPDVADTAVGPPNRLETAVTCLIPPRAVGRTSATLNELERLPGSLDTTALAFVRDVRA